MSVSAPFANGNLPDRGTIQRYGSDCKFLGGQEAPTPPLSWGDENKVPKKPAKVGPAAV